MTGAKGQGMCITPCKTDYLCFICKEFHDKDVQTLKRSCAQQTEAVENVVLKLVRSSAFLVLAFMQSDPGFCGESKVKQFLRESSGTFSKCQQKSRFLSKSVRWNSS